MRINVPEISRQIYKEDTLDKLYKNYSVIGPQWISFQVEWFNGIYASFKDHDKYLIVIFLIKKTLDFYSRNFIKLSFHEFYSKNKVEIEKFNIIEISKKLQIPKETARRKVFELEKEGIIKRIKSKIIIDRSAFPYAKPTLSKKRISRFLATFSKILEKEKILSKSISSKTLEEVIDNNFSYAWKIYYEIQIPMLISYKEIFGQIENFHIFGVCVVNQHLHIQKENETLMNRKEFLKSLSIDRSTVGLNAMSISDITGIPRATVVRKLKYLVKEGFLIIDNKKHYKLKGSFVNKLVPLQNIVLSRLADFSTRIYNLIIL
jgi:DNA-binding Lrp family transcriptional regulator